MKKNLPVVHCFYSNTPTSLSEIVEESLRVYLIYICKLKDPIT